MTIGCINLIFKLSKYKRIIGFHNTIKRYLYLASNNIYHVYVGITLFILFFISAIFDRVDITLNSTQTEEVLDVIAFNENNPRIISVFIGCMFLTVFCVFLWCFFRTNQSDRFAFSFTMSVSMTALLKGRIVFKALIICCVCLGVTWGGGK